MAKNFKYNCLKCDLMYEVSSGVTDNHCFESYYCNNCEKVLDMGYDYAIYTPTLNEILTCMHCKSNDLKFVPGGVTNRDTGEVIDHKCPRCNHNKLLQSAPILLD
jgi:hypothetical protein